MNLQQEAQIPPSLFSPSFPEGAEVERLDRGFRRVELGEVAGAVGYEPLAPTWLPDGFELLHVAVGTEPAANGARVPNPPARDVTILEYGNAYNSRHHPSRHQRRRLVVGSPRHRSRLRRRARDGPD